MLLPLQPTGAKGVKFPKKKVTIALPAAPLAAEDDEEPLAALAATKKVAAANAGATKSSEWTLFIWEGMQLARHNKSNNCYQVNHEEHELEKMVRRDRYVGRWASGAMNTLIDEEDA